MIDRETNIRIVDLLLDMIGELLYAIDPDLMRTDRYEELRLLCDTRLDIDYTAPLDLLEFIKEIREKVNDFLLEDARYDTSYE